MLPTLRFVPPASSPSRRQRQLDQLIAELVKCHACPRLVSWREEVAATKRAAFQDEDYWGKPVPPLGAADARVVVVGLAPAAHGANRTGRMFTGDRSGDFLYRAMHSAGLASQPHAVNRQDGLALQGAYVTAPVKCAPPANKPTSQEKATCRAFISRELKYLTQARVFVALGGIATAELAAVLELKPRPKFGHGAQFQLPDGRYLLCSYHPSQQNTFTGRLTQPMLDEIFARAVKLAATPAEGN